MPARSLLSTLVCAVLMVIAGCGGSPVVVPPDSATPAVVLDAYLRAIQSGNCGGAHALATPDFAQGTAAYCSGMRVTGFGVLSEPAHVNDHEVEFSLALITSGGGYELPDGGHTWFFSLVRQAGGPWRVHGGGTGP
jgi:predicted small lipoprotein YifL